MGARQRRARPDRRLSLRIGPVRPDRSPRAARATTQGSEGAGAALLVLRRLVLSTLLLIAAAACAAETSPVRGTALPLAAETPPERLGPLRFAGALHVTAADRGFGGLSGMLVDPDLTMIGVTDTGLWVRARLLMDDDGLRGIAELDLLPIRDGSGQPLPRGLMADAEALARLPDGRLLVAFERWARIRAFAAPGTAGLFFPAPPGVEQLPANEGLESLTVLADGRLLAIEEGRDGPGPRRAWLGGAPGWTELRYAVEEGWRPTDAAGLPDGGALVLERRFSLLGGFAGRIMHLPQDQLRAAGPDTLLRPAELARLEPPLLADNFEAIAVTPRAAGGLWVFVASDDNFHALQRTLLLAFVLDRPLPR